MGKLARQGQPILATLVLADGEREPTGTLPDHALVLSGLRPPGLKVPALGGCARVPPRDRPPDPSVPGAVVAS